MDKQTKLNIKEADISIAILTLVWGHNTTHVLLTVENELGEIQDLLLLKRSLQTGLSWKGFSKDRSYTVRGYGLEVDSLTGHNTTRLVQPKPDVYSIHSSDNANISRYLQGFTQNLSINLKQRIFNIPTRTRFGSLETCSSEINFVPPLTYYLKPRLPVGSTSGLYIVYSERQKKEYLLMTSHVNIVPLLPISQYRSKYQVQALALQKIHDYTFGYPTVVCSLFLARGKSKLLSVKTCLSKDSLQQLLDRAVSFCRNSTTYTIDRFYRNKPRLYYDNIMNNKHGVMEKYLKDNNGDQHLPINNEINGLFFSASLNPISRRPPDFSFFGDTRLTVPAVALFTDDTNIYFADFYCHYRDHYVTLVLTDEGSPEDDFCKASLLQLCPSSSPFFNVSKKIHVNPYNPTSPLTVETTFEMISVARFHVEFFYTEDVDIRSLQERFGGRVTFTRTVTRGRGESKKEGIPKNPLCKICNLDPSL